MSNNNLSGFFKMAASRFVKATDEEINCFRENAYFSNDQLYNCIKKMGKLPREGVRSTVSSRVRGNFADKFASRGREDKIEQGYFWPREANSSLCAAIVRIELSIH